MSKIRRTIIKDGIMHYWCSKCKSFKTKECFSKGSKYVTGLRSTCKECDKIDSRKYHSEHREQERKYNHNYRKTHKDICIAQLHKYPEKRKARTTFRNYIKYYNIIRPDICPMCGDNGNIEAHHPDYTKWNIILWCCKKCHALIHRGDLDIDENKLTNVLIDKQI